MRPARPILIALGLACAAASVHAAPPGAETEKTEVAIRGDAFRINGRPTYAGRTWRGHSDRRAPAQRPDGPGDLRRPRAPHAVAVGLSRHGALGPRAEHPRVPRRHARLAAPRPARPSRSTSRAAAPQGYSKGRQPWHNSALDERGELRPDFMARLERILDRADELGMVVILGVFYFGQDERLRGRGRRDPRPGRRRRLGPRPVLPQRPDRGEQRVQRRATTTRSSSPSASTS